MSQLPSEDMLAVFELWKIRRVNIVKSEHSHPLQTYASSAQDHWLGLCRLKSRHLKYVRMLLRRDWTRTIFLRGADEDYTMSTKGRMMERLHVILGGRAAEEVLPDTWHPLTGPGPALGYRRIIPLLNSLRAAYVRGRLKGWEQLWTVN